MKRSSTNRRDANQARVGGRPNLREQQKQFTKERLFQTALMMFQERGYALSSVDDIASHAGASRATFYLHFASKAEVLMDIIARQVLESDRLYTELDAAVASGSRAAMAEWMSHALDWYDKHGGILPCIREAANTEPSVRAALESTYQSHVRHMPGYLEQWPSEQAPQARMRILLVTALLSSFYERWAVDKLVEMDRDEVITVLTDVMTAVLSLPSDRA